MKWGSEYIHVHVLGQIILAHKDSPCRHLYGHKYVILIMLGGGARLQLAEPTGNEFTYPH